MKKTLLGCALLWALGYPLGVAGQTFAAADANKKALNSQLHIYLKTGEKTISLQDLRKITFSPTSAVEQPEALQDPTCNVFLTDNSRVLQVDATQPIHMVRVLNLTGQEVGRRHAQENGQQHAQEVVCTLTMPVQWTQGVYIVLVETTNNLTSHKILQP